MERSQQIQSTYSQAFVGSADAHHLNRTDLIGKRVMYRYHRKDWSYFGVIVEMLEGRFIKVRLDSGEELSRHISSFDIKQ